MSGNRNSVLIVFTLALSLVVCLSEAYACPVCALLGNEKYIFQNVVALWILWFMLVATGVLVAWRIVKIQKEERKHAS